FDTWYDITYIIDVYLAEVYLDGEFVGSVDYESSGSDHIMSTILGSGDNIVTYFGRANWGSGEYAKGMTTLPCTALRPRLIWATSQA
ncbi:MAG: hypothetical protein LIO59_05790, partial [Oscillospiraceae bacterium]|nr:hypothetical protein [Oscillospiraceae bacterium]